MKHVLYVGEKNNSYKSLTKSFLEDGFEVSPCTSPSDAFDCLEAKEYQAIVLDIDIQEINGMEVLRELRAESKLPLLIISSRSDVIDKVIALELGADDYLTKPFEPKELLARAKAVIRRCELCDSVSSQNSILAQGSDNVSYPGLKIDKSRYIVIADKNRIDMPPKELELLFFLADNPNRVFTREQLLVSIWGYQFFVASRTVDVHIKRLREKLEDIGKKYNWDIKTVWGVGYKFEIYEDE